MNTASRMESHGLPGEIQVTERAATGLSDGFVVRRRGPIDVKGKGTMVTFLLDGERGAPSTSRTPQSATPV